MPKTANEKLLRAHLCVRLSTWRQRRIAHLQAAAGYKGENDSERRGYQMAANRLKDCILSYECFGSIKRFDAVLGAARIAIAQQRMNEATTSAETARWCRIWRSRLRAFRFAPKAPR